MQTGTIVVFATLAAIAAAYVAASARAGNWGRAGIVLWIIGSQAFLYWEPTGVVAIAGRVALIGLALALVVYAIKLMANRPGDATQSRST